MTRRRHRVAAAFRAPAGHIFISRSLYDAILDNANYAVMNKKNYFEILIDRYVEKSGGGAFILNRLHQTALVRE